MGDVKLEGRLRGLFNIPPAIEMNQKACGDVMVKRRDGSFFRLGYWGGNTFQRENPVYRALLAYDCDVTEGMVGPGTEPQYDIRITFNEEGDITCLSDNRTGMEIERSPAGTERRD